MTKKHAISDVCLNLMEIMIMRYMHFLLNKHHPLSSSWYILEAFYLGYYLNLLVLKKQRWKVLQQVSEHAVGIASNS